jgi:Tfp pilus assembly protein PilV
MEVLIALAVLVIALAGFDAAAIAYGTDSREQLPDDHRR